MNESLRAYLRRQAKSPDAPGNIIEDLRQGLLLPEARERRGLPRAMGRGIESFYELLKPGEHHVCDGTACHFAGGPKWAAELNEHGVTVTAVRCLGRCYAPPACDLEPAPPLPRRTLNTPPIVLRDVLGDPPVGAWQEYALPEGEVILERLEASGLRGRGGAAYPTAAKWRAARDAPGPVKWVVANGDEGDPGSYVDRLLLEEAPHTVLAGMLACARVIEATHGIVYIRAEYPEAQVAMRQAIRESVREGWLGAHFDVQVISGAGSYVCGEETALLNSIEGFRGEPRPKPPYPAQAGLHGQPTVVQNVETLSLIPWIVTHRRGAGNKAFCLSGCVAHPGVVEAPLGITLRTLLTEGGGGPKPGSHWKLALVGGPLGRVVPEARFDEQLSYETLPGLGHGGVVALDETVSVRALAEHLFEFARAESCGSCAPCRLGTALLHQLPDRDSLERVLTTMEEGSLCGFGPGVARPIRDLLEHFGEELFPC